MKLLLISNSFGVNLQTYAKEIAKENDFNLEIYTLYIGGCPLELHDKNIKENKKDYELFVDGTSTGKFVSINDTLEMEEWDYISLQQASHVSGDVSSYYPYFKNVYTYVLKLCPHAKIMFHKTWPYSGKNKTKFNEVKTWLPSFKFIDDVEMKKGIDEAVERISNDFKIDLIIDSAKVVFEGMKIFDDLYDSEGFHLNKLGCLLIGLNLIKKLISGNVKLVEKIENFDEKTLKKATDFINQL